MVTVPFIPWAIAVAITGMLCCVSLYLYRAEIRTAAIGILRYRERRTEEIVRRVLEEREAKRMRRIAEVTVMHHTEDPEQRGRIAEKIRERWEKEDEAARCADDERSR